jgi:hypothetical protein
MTLSNDGHVRFWHKADIQLSTGNFRFWGKADIPPHYRHVCV